MPVVLVAWFTGAMAGLGLSAPIGPVNLLCIRRTLAGGVRPGLAIGLGAACADLLYAFVASRGIANLTSVARAVAEPLQAICGVVLIGIGGWMLAGRTPAAARPARSTGEPAPRIRTGRGFVTAFLLTASNPVPALSLSATVSRFDATPALPIAFVAGVGTGAILWWSALVLAANRMTRETTTRLLENASRACGLALVLCGVVVLCRGGHPCVAASAPGASDARLVRRAPSASR